MRLAEYEIFDLKYVACMHSCTFMQAFILLLTQQNENNLWDLLMKTQASKRYSDKLGPTHASQPHRNTHSGSLLSNRKTDNSNTKAGKQLLQQQICK